MKPLKFEILKEINIALDEARQSERPAKETIHSVRRRCKRIRAYLRLLPSSLAKESRRAREGVRQAAALLSTIRDSQVMVPMCDMVQKRLAEIGVDQLQIDELATSIRERVERVSGVPSASERALKNAAVLLEEASTLSVCRQSKA